MVSGGTPLLTTVASGLVASSQAIIHHRMISPVALNRLSDLILAFCSTEFRLRFWKLRFCAPFTAGGWTCRHIRSVYVMVGPLSMLLACPTVPANPISIHYVLPIYPSCAAQTAAGPATAITANVVASSGRNLTLGLV